MVPWYLVWRRISLALILDSDALWNIYWIPRATAAGYFPGEFEEALKSEPWVGRTRRNTDYIRSPSVVALASSRQSPVWREYGREQILIRRDLFSAPYRIFYKAGILHSYEKPALSILAEGRQAFESNGQIYLTDESQEANFSDWAAQTGGSVSKTSHPMVIPRLAVIWESWRRNRSS